MSDQHGQGTLQELQDTLDEIKHLWQQGDTMDLPSPIERARMLASDLENGDEESRGERDDCLYDTVVVRDLYPFEELRERAIEDAKAGLDQFDVSPEEAEIRWMMVEDGVLHYKITHEDIPTIKYEAGLP